MEFDAIVKTLRFFWCTVHSVRAIFSILLIPDALTLLRC